MKLRPPRAPGFIGNCDTRIVEELAGTHRMLAKLGFYSAELDCTIWVPKYFITDFASVPRIPFFYMVVGGKGKKAAVIHDFLYSGGLVHVGGVDRVLTRAECDSVFAEALRATGYGALVVGIMYSGVHLGGASHFKAPNVPQDVASVVATMGAGSLEAA
jgi:hypothetical protein